MKILLAPSERKSKGGDEKISFCFDIDREDIIKRYEEFLQETEDIKNFGEDKTPIFQRGAKKAILRYTGVAFEYLDYLSLDEISQKWIDENVFIFSNLFGVLCAKDKIPYYVLKQGKMPGFDIYKEYKNIVTPILDEINKNEIFIDLRAKFYEKVYKPKNSITFKFIKNNKVVSHFAKAYRGKLTRIISMHRPTSVEELLKIEFDGVKVLEIIEKRGVKEIVCEVV